MATSRRLDEQFPINANEEVAPTLRRILRALEARFAQLEEQRAEYEAAITHLNAVGLARINDVLLPASQRILEYSSLGFLLVKSATPITLTPETQQTFVVNEGAQRELWTPTPFVAIQREQSSNDFAIGRVNSFDRENGHLLVFIAAAFGDPGPHHDWTISAAPGVSLATRSYYEGALEAKQAASSDAAQAAADRVFVAASLAALQSAGLTPEAYVRHDGARPFSAPVAGIAPPATFPGEGNILVPANWVRSILDYDSPSTQFIQPTTTWRRGIIIKAGTFIRLDIPERPGDSFVWQAAEDIAYTSAEALLDDGTSFLPGRDYYVYLVLAGDGKSAAPKVSLNTTAPVGSTIANSRKIGGFHTLCVSKGTDTTYVRGGQEVSHDLNGWLAGDILPASVWDLKHRPHGDRSPQPGHVFEKYLGFWGAIYGQSSDGPNTMSAYQGPIRANRQYGEFVEDQLCVGNTLLSDEEFSALALGSPEQVNVAGGAEANAINGGAGGRSATNGHRIISYCGAEEMVGCLWAYLRTTSAAGNYGYMIGQLANGTQGGFFVSWDQVGGQTSVQTQPFPQSGGKGSYWGIAAALLAGGSWNNAAGCGSRARIASYSRSYALAGGGGRGRAAPRDS